jgi:hypothetical protein
LAKFPLALGLIVFWFRRLTRQQRRIIEYKGAGPDAAPGPPGAATTACAERAGADRHEPVDDQVMMK